jgi:pimeloyl-ACP methyl ester carboxylesterase
VEYQFQSNGTNCAGTLMLPDARELRPIIIMGHGFANIRTARLPAFAERFVEAGYAAFLFDYRTFGDSEGEPRHWVHPWRQIEDWEAAIRYAKSRPDVDASRIILWGTSFSGGHVLQIAARDPELTAVIAQIPHVSGPATAMKAHPATIAKSVVAGFLDVAAGVLNRTIYSPVVGKPGELAAITGDQAYEAYEALLPMDANWKNRLLSRSLVYVPLYSPRRYAKRITAPVLMIAARNDAVVSASAARRAAQKIPDCTFHLLGCDHFQPYTGEHFEENIALQLQFLRERVPVE